jgi:pyridoxamine 5'-phosphate oxidase
VLPPSSITWPLLIEAPTLYRNGPDLAKALRHWRVVSLGLRGHFLQIEYHWRSLEAQLVKIVHIPTHQDPITTVRHWLDAAGDSEAFNPTATALATISADGAPSIRMVLLKDIDPAGFTFYTNLHSRKARELDGDARAALCLYWKSLRRQVRIEGTTERLTTEEADAYFATRERGSQIGAWASCQSAKLDDRASLEAAVLEIEQRFAETEVPRPEFWSGYRLVPRMIELWWELPSRLHERVEFVRQPGGDWAHQSLYP